ncbi:carotenoid oxygenase family protein [Alteromonas lipolytica]|uniref:Uncharacterized protein n=1 Tax=Alteromonas lipolytica TaxID=1856405 RepID=A0A1E8FJK2_9ALTE|nr:carotenoid oxygenase family protein [Alteromonas lipolytica]OFI35613.1 hypothetical protein BFC17_12720 [Alteromonas lipolytica]GGF77593.1 hypothetical protein GCM10011338_32460 [Alteromonas lipolytica]
MDRRDFLKNMSMAACGALVSSAGFNALAADNESYYQQFKRQLKANPILRGWEGLSADIAPREFTWQGKLPDALVGRQFYRNGPARAVLGNQRYTHWFDGDGFVHRYAFGKQAVTHSGRFVRTKKFNAESRAGRFLYNGAGSVIENARPSKSAETVNTANIALLPVNGDLWALWEAAMPYNLDPTTLETKGQVSLDNALDGVPFSAHPHADRFGNIWNFGDLSFFGQPAMVIYQLNSQGKLLQYKMVSAPASYVHDFAVTDNHLIFYFPPITKQHGAETLIDSMQWHKDQPGQLLVIDKNTLTPVMQVPFDSGFVFHFGNAWQQGQQLVVNACWYNNADVMLNGVNSVIAEQAQQHHRSTAAQIHIDLSANTARLQSTNHEMEFVQFDGRFTGKPTAQQFGVYAANTAGRADYNSIAALNTESGVLDLHRLGNDFLTEEPLFIPTGNKPGEGYLVNTALNFKEGATYCMVFNAQHVSDGPVAWVKLDNYMPMGFHGAVI